MCCVCKENIPGQLAWQQELCYCPVPSLLPYLNASDSEWFNTEGEWMHELIVFQAPLPLIQNMEPDECWNDQA